MPNWCNNKLTIEDCSPELEEFLKTEGFSFNKIKPTPAELLENEGWYDWNIDNWGQNGTLVKVPKSLAI